MIKKSGFHFNGEKMTRQSRKPEDEERPICVSDLIETLKRLENLLESPGYDNQALVDFIRNMRRILQPFRRLRQKEFVVLLQDSLDVHHRQRNGAYARAKTRMDPMSPTLKELRSLLADGVFTKEQLLDIANQRFGIPRGSSRKLRKDQIRDLIEGAMRNIETHNVIRSKASE